MANKLQEFKNLAFWNMCTQERVQSAKYRKVRRGSGILYALLDRLDEIMRAQLSAFCDRRRCDRFLPRVRSRARESHGRESLLVRGMRPARYHSIFSISFDNRLVALRDTL